MYAFGVCLLGLALLTVAVVNAAKKPASKGNAKYDPNKPHPWENLPEKFRRAGKGEEADKLDAALNRMEEKAEKMEEIFEKFEELEQEITQNQDELDGEAEKETTFKNAELQAKMASVLAEAKAAHGIGDEVLETEGNESPFQKKK